MVASARHFQERGASISAQLACTLRYIGSENFEGNITGVSRSCRTMRLSVSYLQLDEWNGNKQASRRSRAQARNSTAEMATGMPVSREPVKRCGTSEINVTNKSTSTAFVCFRTLIRSQSVPISATAIARYTQELLRIRDVALISWLKPLGRKYSVTFPCRFCRALHPV